MKTQLLAAALIAAAGLAGAAAAGSLDSRPGDPGGHGPVKVLVIVSSQGLDLTTDVGADQFLGRLTFAVNTACDDRPTDGPALTMTRSGGFAACRAQALETAMTYVRSPIAKRRYAAIEAKDNLRLARR
jgi:UrcA family protein